MRDEKDKTKAHIRFAPTPDQQARLMMQLVVRSENERVIIKILMHR